MRNLQYTSGTVGKTDMGFEYFVLLIDAEKEMNNIPLGQLYEINTYLIPFIEYHVFEKDSSSIIILIFNLNISQPQFRDSMSAFRDRWCLLMKSPAPRLDARSGIIPTSKSISELSPKFHRDEWSV